jgi:hypothetical protein
LSVSDVQKDLESAEASMSDLLRERSEVEAILREVDSRLSQEPLLTVARRLESGSRAALGELAKVSKRAQRNHRYDTSQVTVFEDLMLGRAEAG